jgi:glycine/D-amino acid oxidase-like deaminating enzyme
MRKLTTDILVIGGGSTGTGVAWDAALRGFRVVLVEKRDLTHGTTGRYHGLLHSGGRYAVKDPQSAIECIEENRILRRTHTHCIEDTSGFFVVTPEDEGDFPDRFKAGCANVGIPCEEISVKEALRREPLLNPRISRVFEVPDGSADSFLATHVTAQAAQQAGATDSHLPRGDRPADRRRRRCAPRHRARRARHGQRRRGADRRDADHQRQRRVGGQDRGAGGHPRARDPRQGRDGGRQSPPRQHRDQPLQDARGRRHPGAGAYRRHHRHHRRESG